MKEYCAIGLFVLALFLPQRVYCDVSLSGDVSISAGASTDAPTAADYVVGTANDSLSAEQSLGLLTTGLLKNTVSGGTGTLSTATAGTDYVVPTVTSLSSLTGVSSGLTGMLKAASGTLSVASAGTDYAAPSTTMTGLVQSTASGTSYITGGNVGIGITNPQATLHIGDSTATGQRVIIQGSTSGDFGLLFNEGSYTAGSENGVLFREAGASNRLDIIGLSSGAETNVATFMRGGNVGIGTTNPRAKLEVNNAIRTVNIGTDYIYSDDGSSVVVADDNLIVDNGSVGIGYSLLGTGKLAINGNVGIGTTNPVFMLDVDGDAQFGLNQDLTPTSTGLVGQLLVDGNGYNSFWALDGTAMYLGHNSSGRRLDLMTNETTRLSITGAGSVGIGTTDPGAKLSIRGNMSGGALRVEQGVAGDLAQFWSDVDGTGSQVVTIQRGGNVGIGTTNPGSYKLYVNGATYINGNHTISGTKSAVVPTSQGMRKLYTLEAADSRFEDFGSSRLDKGRAEVKLDPLFLETVTISAQYPMIITLTLTSDSPGIYVAQKTANSFMVKEIQGGKGSPTFDYRVTAMRKGYEDKRLELVDASSTGKRN